MPRNKKESLIYTFLMCAFMVIIMSVYNVARHIGLHMGTLKEAWIGFPVAFVVAFICDVIIVSKPAKALAFKIVGMEAKPIVKIFAVSTCMVCGMVICMSLFGAIEQNGVNGQIFGAWIKNIGMNFIFALPLQLIIAGPFIRFAFRKLFPVGTIVCNDH